MNQTHAAILHCPFCAEEDLHPADPADLPDGTTHGGWACRSCLRVFSVRLLGLARRTASPGDEGGPR